MGRIEEWAAFVQGRNHTIVNNRFSGGEGVSRSGGALRLVGADHEVAANTLGGVHGVYIQSATGSVEVHHNRLSGIYQLRVGQTELCTGDPAGAAVVDVHANTFSVRESGESVYGILNEDDEVLNATNNYWGAESGPSSPDGTSVSDPVTGTAADGSGASISAGVHFDPWLRHQPANRTTV